MKKIYFYKIINLLFLISLLIFEPAHANNNLEEESKAIGIDSFDLTPLPEAKPLLLQLVSVLNDPQLLESLRQSKTLQSLNERVRTNLFHLNFIFDVQAQNYPYDPVFKQPFPFRPTLEAINDAINFFEILEATAGYRNPLLSQLKEVPYFRKLQAHLAKTNKSNIQQSPIVIDKETMKNNPVDSYLVFKKRLDEFGESASFPEFEYEVKDLITALKADEIKLLMKTDKAFEVLAKKALNELLIVSSSSGRKTQTNMGFSAAYPYRRTHQAIEQALTVLDFFVRQKYPQSENWHEVEKSWYVGNEQKLLPRYHINRYKYQLFGLLANPEIILIPWGESLTEADLISFRSVPLSPIGVSSKTLRVDRHHMTPVEFYYHDVNHIRRMYGYDKRKRSRVGAQTPEQIEDIYRQQAQFVKELLHTTEPNTGNETEDELRKLERVIIFETLHETALTADAKSLISDLNRVPATPQPFELQVQTEIKNIEEIRTFDGNLKSGADQLPLNLDKPTKIRFFYDRAPGFLANNDNKLRWGFQDSTYDPQDHFVKVKYRAPEFLARAATRLYQRLGVAPPDFQILMKYILDRRGLEELYNYYSLEDVQKNKNQRYESYLENSRKFLRCINFYK